MTTRICRGGVRTTSMERDSDGHRTYKITFRVESDSSNDGPATVLLTPGLPLPGATWLVGTDQDIWAWCRWDTSIKPISSDGPNRQWDVDKVFSTKPIEKGSCRTIQVENPLLEPQKVSGGSEMKQTEIAFDRFGNFIRNPAWEQIRGPQVEFDDPTHVIRVEQNVAVLNLALCNNILNKVNAFPIWGMPRRTVKLNRFNWEAKYYGFCFKYYTRQFDFGINLHYDRDLVPEGTKVLKGGWNRTTGVWQDQLIGGVPPNAGNPAHFMRFKDLNNENARVILDCDGRPWTPLINTTSACSECTQAPLQWTASGFSSVWSNANVVLSHTGGCSWVGVSNNGENRLSLDFSGADWVLTLDFPLQPSAGSYTWSLPISDFSCMSSNIFDWDLTSAEAIILGLPLKVTLVPGNLTPPCTLHVEFYDEADFLFLGVPIAF